MPTRRSHTNSHHGCVQCKARRVKCDQAHPACARCSKRGQQCAYRDLLSAYDPFQRRRAQEEVEPGKPQTTPSGIRRDKIVARRPPPSSAAAQEGNSSTAIVPRPKRSLGQPGLEADTARLLHHFATSIGNFFTHPFREFDILVQFDGAIRRHALTSPYVHHAVLAFSALHLASLSSPGMYKIGESSKSSALEPSRAETRRYLVTALTHRAAALGHLRPELDSISEETCEQALTASALLLGSAWALPLIGKAAAASSLPEDHDPIALLAQISALFQGSVTLFRLGWGLNTSQPLDVRTSPRLRQAVIEAVENEKDWPEAEEAVKRILNAVVSCTNGTLFAGIEGHLVAAIEAEEDEEEEHDQVGGGGGVIGKGGHVSCHPPVWRRKWSKRQEVLLDAGYKLRTALRRVAAVPTSYHVASMWLVSVRPALFILVRARDPLALVMVAHWVVALQGMPHVWWTRGWAEWTIRAVASEVGPEHEDLMRWPLEVLERGGPWAPDCEDLGDSGTDSSSRGGSKGRGESGGGSGFVVAEIMEDQEESGQQVFGCS